MAEPGQDCGGTNEHARAKWAGQFETRRYLVEYAHFARSATVSIIANSMVGHPLDSLPVPLTQNIMSTCIIILRTGGCVYMSIPPYRSVSYQNFVGALPPQVKYCGGACPPCPPPPPGSTAYAREIDLDRTEYVHDNHSILLTDKQNTKRSIQLCWGVFYNMDQSEARSIHKTKYHCPYTE